MKFLSLNMADVNNKLLRIFFHYRQDLEYADCIPSSVLGLLPTPLPNKKRSLEYDPALYLMVRLGLVLWVLWHIKFCRLSNTKSIFIQINSSIWNYLV